MITDKNQKRYKLFHYIHCPFCVRVRFGLGLLNIDYESIVLDYDDEKTPLKLTGVKMLPILEMPDNSFLNESLDILLNLDSKNILNKEVYFENKEEIDVLLNRLGKDIHNLCMPYWIYTKEFTPKAREYFQNKKQAKRGPFNKLIQNKELYLKSLNQTLKIVEERLDDFFLSNDFSLADIVLASHLWGMYIFPEFQFSEKIHNYLQDIKLKTKFEYHEDLWID